MIKDLEFKLLTKLGIILNDLQKEKLSEYVFPTSKKANLNEIKKITDELIDTFIFAGKKSIELRNLGLKKEIKSDNTPVTNGDIEVDNIITKKIKTITPDIPIISEE